MVLKNNIIVLLRLWFQLSTKLHLENSSNTKSLNALERKVTEVLAFEKYMVEKTAKLYDDYNRNSAIGKFNSL